MELAFAKTKTVGINFDYDIWINVVFADDNFYPIVHEALFNQSEPRLDGRVTSAPSLSFQKIKGGWA